jgi:hypothetical protein
MANPRSVDLPVTVDKGVAGAEPAVVDEGVTRGQLGIGATYNLSGVDVGQRAGRLAEDEHGRAPRPDVQPSQAGSRFVQVKQVELLQPVLRVVQLCAAEAR